MNMKDSMRYFLVYYDKEIIKMISTKYGFDFFEALKNFLNSETYKMLKDKELEMWEFGCPAIFEMWECEQITGDPRNSAYLNTN